MENSLALAQQHQMWESSYMSDTFKLQVGEKGRVVIPSEIRSRHNWEQGTELLLLNTDRGVTITTADDVLDALTGSLKGTGTVAEFLAERRKAAGDENVDMGK
jgi:AbrB family looped-hinge helix DNA binding protein